MALQSLTNNRTTVPERLKALPRDERGYPIPWFVYRDSKGVPDFRVAATHKIHEAIEKRRCWICGGPLQTSRAFVVGPLGVVNRVSPEPPSHRSCAVFAATTCPFLTQPGRQRNPVGLPAAQPPPGEMFTHNPGIVAVWIARGFRTIQVDYGVLFKMREPVEPVRWYCQAKPALRSEVLRAMSRSLGPVIDETRGDPEAFKQLMKLIDSANEYLPANETNGAAKGEGDGDS